MRLLIIIHKKKQMYANVSDVFFIPLFRNLDGFMFVIWRSNFNSIERGSKAYLSPKVIQPIKSKFQLNILYHA